MLHTVIHSFSQSRSLGLIGTVCLVAFIFSCECETDSPTASVAATSIVIDQGEGPLPIVKNNSNTLSATVLPANHTEGDVEWSSSSDEIASVTKDDATTATYTGLALGSTIITATVGRESARIIIRVTSNSSTASVAATSIVINQGEGPLSIVKNNSDTLSATVLPANHTEGDVEWTSSSDEIASVTKDDATTATYTGVALGTATITATVGGVSTNIVINVTSNAIPASNITIEQGARLSTNLGSMGRLTATVLPANHTEGALTWFSSNTQAVTVNRDSGEYTAVATGESTVTVTVGGVSAAIVIEVVPNIVLASNITIDQGDSIVTNLGSQGFLSATVLPTNHTEGQVEWTSSRDDIVSVSKDDTNTATFMAVALGSAIRYR